MYAGGGNQVDRRPFGSFDDFAAVTDPARFTSAPDDWVIGLTDVVRSTEAVAEGSYKAVNLAGAAAIAAVMNALGTRDFAFAFAGDGCAFALPGADAELARQALAATVTFTAPRAPALSGRSHRPPACADGATVRTLAGWVALH